MKLTREEIREKLGVLIEDDYAYVEIMDKKQYKSNKQNRLFHGLLTCFWKSGCSSYISYDDMRKHYKMIAGLIKYKYESGLEEYTKKCVWKCIKILKLNKIIKDEQFNKLVEMIKGRVEIEESWSEVTKKNAQITLDLLMQDMDMSNVLSSSQGKKYEEILRGLGEWYEI